MFYKTYHFYIDESGHLENNSSLFMIGCVRTDAAMELDKNITDFWSELMNDIYFEENIDKIVEKGMHAVENHPDMRSELYSRLPLMNFRSFFVLIKKNTAYFKDLRTKMSMEEMYLLMLNRLLRDRLAMKNAKLIFHFEQLEFPNESQPGLLKRFFATYKGKVDFEFHIVTKTFQFIGLTDYMNYVFFKLFENPGKQEPRMLQNFRLLEDKIALVHVMHTGSYFSRTKGISIEQITKDYDG